MNVWQFLLSRIIDILLIFLILYLAGILKRKFGKSISDYFLNAAGIAVRSTEQLSAQSREKIPSEQKKKMALAQAKKILEKENIRLDSDDESLLSDMIEAEVYELNRGTRV